MRSPVNGNIEVADQQQHDGPVARVIRDAFLPIVLRLSANGKQLDELYGYHVEWDTATKATSA